MTPEASTSTSSRSTTSTAESSSPAPPPASPGSSSAVDAFRAENPNTVFAAAGDLIGASTFTSFIQQDVPTIDALNAAGLDVSAVGNHEFDQGFADLTDRVMPLADWEYLGANVYDKDDGDPALPEYWTAKFQGVTIGFVGAVTDELPSLVSPAGIEDITVGSPVEAANRVADQLSDGKKNNGEADIVIMLVHEGAVRRPTIASATDPNTRFGEIVLNANDNIDAIVSGHTHLAVQPRDRRSIPSSRAASTVSASATWRSATTARRSPSPRWRTPSTRWPRRSMPPAT